MIKRIKRIKIKEFDEWLEKCPIPYNTSCSNNGLTEVYEFDTSECEYEDYEN